ncbi:MAG: hypothetical protein ACTJGH_04235 [Peptoniphilaceae bacterium]
MTEKTFIIENETSEFNHSLPDYYNEGYSLFSYDEGSCLIGSTKNMEPFSISYATLAKAISYGTEAIVAYSFSFRTGLIDINVQVVYDIHDFWSTVRTLSDLYLSIHGTFHGIGKCQRRCRVAIAKLHIPLM